MWVKIDGKEDGMDTPGFASLIRVYSENLQQMRKSNDISDTEPTYLDSLGVMDLDTSLNPDAFGLRAFDRKVPITRMLPGSGPCDLRLLIPDAGLGKAGFHDVVIENLLGTSIWKSKTYGGKRIGVTRRLIVTRGGATARSVTPGPTMHWILI